MLRKKKGKEQGNPSIKQRALETGNTAKCIKLAKLRVFFVKLEGHNYR